ncbi:hypothetical protein TRV_01516 [Trichophyton verrucosum HKI 0517]|uniref:Poly(A) polymerase n=1 Tax=Trichophyton verrucosum (strain HKI 0517) TaxID=663202 RepID=D4D359_TRIVH|nr:uncharacterized protein TRV_01516 [Trichophyton verrucosum HKI 0517]EFE43707.1 hypothetical protein TRV_01516 [Trichophyton verrucosum HKI 0517]
MAASQSRQWGITPPLSSALPTPSELAENDALIAELKLQNNFEPPSETEKRFVWLIKMLLTCLGNTNSSGLVFRKQTLHLLQRVTIEFIKVVSKEKGLSQAAIDASGGSDIDTLVVAPKHVMREDFFAHFPAILEKHAPKDAIEKMTPVPDAFVPIIKIEIFGISIDLIFARLIVSSVPPNLDLKNKDLLRGLDEREIRCVNGTRVTDEILELVPQQKTFRLALRAIKLWAQRRAIYSNIVGFPGGVAWAMLVARVCQLYPQATGSVIVGKFFRIMNQWSWPQPVLLKHIEDGPLHMKVWNPKVGSQLCFFFIPRALADFSFQIYHGDRFHLMPIITPAYPSMCATHNVSMSTKAVILRELRRGGDMVDKIFVGQRRWSDLFARHSFFSADYKYYLSINSTSTSKEAQAIWSGLVESKLRHLVGALDRKSSIEIAHPFPKGFERVHICKTDEEVDAVKAGSMKYQADDTKTATTDETNDPTHIAAAENANENVGIAEAEKPTGENKYTLYTTTYYIGLELKPLAPDISSDTHMFKNTCTSWAQYQPGVNDLNISHVRNYDLPDDVFQPGEVRPTRPKKKVVKKVEQTVSQKRNIDAVDVS